MPHDWLLHGQWLGNTALAWVGAGGGALLGYLIAHGLAVFLHARLRRLAERTGRRSAFVAADVAGATRGWLLLLIALAVALEFLHFGGASPHWLGQLTFILVGAQLAFWSGALVTGWLNRAAAHGESKPANPVLLGILTWTVQFVIWITLLLAALANGGVEITAFVASLGVGGVAVALALQNILTDLFSSIAIGLDKPFEVGEYIAFDTVEGTVLKVGIKSTRMRSASGEELAVSNSVLLKNLIHNYSRMRERRVVFTLKLPFDTQRERLPEAVARVRQLVEREPATRFGYGYLARFGEYALEFEFAYFVLEPGFDVFAATQQRIHLAILAAFDELGVTLAARGTSTPTTTPGPTARANP